MLVLSSVAIWVYLSQYRLLTFGEIVMFFPFVNLMLKIDPSIAPKVTFSHLWSVMLVNSPDDSIVGKVILLQSIIVILLRVNEEDDYGNLILVELEILTFWKSILG